MRFLTTIFIVIIFFSQDANAQFGDLLKNKGVNLVKKKGKTMLLNELQKTKDKFDSTSFSYAISLSDKAAQFENKDKLSDLVTVSSMVLDEKKSKTVLQEAREYMDIGEMAYSANAFKLAEGSFIASNALLIDGGYEENPLYGRGLANLGLLYNGMGRFGAAEQFTRWALEIREKYRGKDSKDYAASLNNLAVLNKDLGNYNVAEKEITEAIGINLATLGDESIAYAISLNNRGVLYQTLGRYSDAEHDIKLALEVAAKSLKSYSLQYTRLQSNLALLYQQQGKYPEAETIYNSAISAIIKNPTKSKKTNPDYAHMIENLASLYVQMNNNSDAEKLYLEALSVYERKFSNRYSGYGLTSARLGALYLQQKNLNDAEKHLISAEGILNSTFGAQHPYTVDLQVQLGVLYWLKDDVDIANKNFTLALDKSLEFVGEYFAPMSDTEKAMYWKTLQPRFEKYYAFTASIENKKVTHNAFQYRLATKAMLLSGSTKVKKQILESGDEELIEDYQTWLDQKGSLAHYYSMSKEDLQEQKVNLDSIEREANKLEKSLSEKSGLFSAAYGASTPTVEDIQAKLEYGEKAVELIHVTSDLESGTVYLALVISPDKIEKITLENGDELDGKYFKLYRNLIRLKKPDTYSYAQYWQPIDNLLSDAQKVYISLDGVYNQISINSLQDSNGQYLLDKQAYVIVSSLRGLNEGIEVGSANKKSAALFGDPQYGSASIDALPGTGREVAAVKGILDKSGYGTKLEIGDKATESSIKSISNKGLVHIATHGFFVADPKGNKTSVFSIPLYNINENILLRSGLLLAGAGKQEIEGNLLSGGDNGILTSYEVLNMNLENTDLVVLSACETGLGDVMAGEGVYGLQRAFMVAGASNVIMSLWKVDDEATQKLMVLFYSNWLKTGNMENAFAMAQKEVKELYKHPYYWGSFVLLRN